MFTRPIRFVVTLLMVGFSAVLAQAALPPPPPPPTTADVVYGQMGSFTTNTNNNGGRSANSAADPAGAAVDSSGNLYVGDTGNNRVLFYPAGTTTATRVYGQLGSFTTGGNNQGGLSANSLNNPYGVAVDSSDNLYVADYLNNRVLFYPSGSTTATRVYGQNGSFTTNVSGVSATGLNGPNRVVLDSGGNLYVADSLNNRVLFYPSGSTTATRVYGQGGSFTTGVPNNGGISANSLDQPLGVVLDSSGNLYVADSFNNRVLFYPSGSTTATQVYGQLGSFTTNTANLGGISANSLSRPFGVSLDSSGNLYVADTFNNRLLFYFSGSTTATRVYGQLGSFTSNTANNGGVSANSLDEPEGVPLDSSGNLYVCDYGNNRMLLYPPTTTPGVYGPVNGSTLTGNSVPFWWAGYPGATAYWLDVGSTSGGNNYYQSGSLSASIFGQSVNSLPSDGSAVYATWWYFVGGSWSYVEYQYNAFGTSPEKGVITSPAPTSMLTGSSVTFTWTAGNGATAYWIDAGSSAGGNQYYQSGNLGNVLTQTVNNLPTNGSTVYVTLYSLVGGQWLNNQYTYTAFNASSCLSTITSPAAGTTLTAYSDTFGWTASTNPGCSGAVTSYWLDAGTTTSENFYYQSGNIGLVTSWTTGNNLPPGYGGGQPPPNNQVQMTLWNLIGGTWVPSPEVGYCGYGSSGYPACN
jgi:NHL repeat